MGRVPDAFREQRYLDALQHVRAAQNQRDYYKTWIMNTDDSTKVLSFDFAQTVHYPVSPQQPGSAYFATARKCAVFGITNEKEKIQVRGIDEVTTYWVQYVKADCVEFSSCFL